MEDKYKCTPKQEWVVAAGGSEHRPTSSCYDYDKDNNNIIVVKINDIEPLRRYPDTEGLQRDRTINIIKGMVSGDFIPPICVEEITAFPSVYKYKLRDGYHRFYLSRHFKYTMIPVLVLPPQIDIFSI